MDKTNIIEIIRNGKVVKTVKGFDALDKYIDPILSDLRSRNNRFKGWQEVHAVTGGGWGYNVFFNERSLTTDVIAWRCRYSFKDCNGNYVHHGVKLISKFGVYAWLYEHPEGYCNDDRWLYMYDGAHDRWEITPEEIAENWSMDMSTIHFPEISPKK